MPDVVIALQLETLVCGNSGCGIVFAVPSHWLEERRRDHKGWSCPNGHERYFPAKSDEEKLREALATANGNLNYYRELYQDYHGQTQKLQRQLTAQKSATTRAMRRMTNGVCLECNRHFANVQRHMERQHPERVVSADRESLRSR